MRQFFFLLILSALIALSSLARANNAIEVPAYYEVTSFSEDSLILNVEGFYPNECTKDASAVFIVEDGVLVIDVLARQQTPYCVRSKLTGRSFNLRIDIGALRPQLAELGLDQAGTYQVKTLDGRVNTVVDFGAILFVQPYAREAAVEKLTPAYLKKAVVVDSSEIFSN